MDKQKIIIIAAGVILFIIVLLVVILSNLSRTQQTGSITPTPSIIPTIDINDNAAQVTAYVQHQLEHYDEEFGPSIAIDAAEIALMPDGVPDDFIPVVQNDGNTSSSKLSPGGDMEASIDSNGLTVTNIDENTTISQFPFENTISQSAFIWLQEDLILLVEKESIDPEIDRIYLIDLALKSKTFIVGSFPVPSRFNLRREPEVYNEGNDIVFTDNENQKWLLTIVYR